MAPHGQVRSEGATLDGPESRYAWRRLFLSLLLSTIGGIGLWSNVVVLPALQADFGVARGSATLPYTLTMIGFAFGGIWMGRLADRRGVVFPVSVGAIALSIGYIASAQATNLWQFAIVQGAVVGLLGSSATFGPLVADISHWFTRNRGIAVAICASGNYLSGTVWPPILQHLVANYGWRETHIGIGIFCAAQPQLPPLPRILWRRRRRQGCRSRPMPYRRSWSSPGSPAALRCRCRKCTSSPIARISAMAWRVAPRCCR